MGRDVDCRLRASPLSSPGLGSPPAPGLALPGHPPDPVSSARSSQTAPFTPGCQRCPGAALTPSLKDERRFSHYFHVTPYYLTLMGHFSSSCHCPLGTFGATNIPESSHQISQHPSLSQSLNTLLTGAMTTPALRP